jgi:F-type H+-transporting ATPase subunit b
VQIDWFTLVAEIINFLILVVLLKYFLYDRIINVVDERETKIATRFKEAEQQQEEARQEAEAHQAKQQQLVAQREELLAKAKEEAAARRKELLEQARREVDETQNQWRQALQREQDAFFQELRRRTAQQTYALARQALADLAGAGLEERLVNRFVERLEHLDEEQRAEIATTIQESDQALVISTAFELPPHIRQDLLAALRQQFGDGLEGQFKTSPDLISGIELKANGHKLAWSLDNYLAALEENLAHVLDGMLDQSNQNQKDVISHEQ